MKRQVVERSVEDDDRLQSLGFSPPGAGKTTQNENQSLIRNIFMNKD